VRSSAFLPVHSAQKGESQKHTQAEKSDATTVFPFRKGESTDKGRSLPPQNHVKIPKARSSSSNTEKMVEREHDVGCQQQVQDFIISLALLANHSERWQPLWGHERLVGSASFARDASFNVRGCVCR
jgi:hypothetical protein